MLLTTQAAKKRKGKFAEVSVLPLSIDQLSRWPIRLGFDYIGLQSEKARFLLELRKKKKPVT